MEIKPKQRFLYTSSYNVKKRFICEVVQMHDTGCAKIVVLQDLGYGIYVGYIFESIDISDINDWTYLPGQEAP